MLLTPNQIVGRSRQQLYGAVADAVEEIDPFAAAILRDYVTALRREAADYRRRLNERPRND